MYHAGGATGGRHTSLTSDNVSMSPTFSDSVFSDIDDGQRNSRESRSHRNLPGNVGNSHMPSSGSMPIPPMDSNRLFVPIKKKRAQSPPGSSPDRGSESGTYGSTSSTRNRLVDFDLEPRYEHYSNRPSSEPATLNLATGSGAAVSNDGARPKTAPSVNFAVNGNGKKDRKNVSNLKLTGTYSSEFNSDYKNFPQDVTRPVSNDSGVSSSRFVESNENVHLSEQQNTNVDETRFSAALSLFDPLAQDGDMASGDLLEGPGSPSARSPPFHGFSNPNYNEEANKEYSPVPNKPDSSQFTFNATPVQSIPKNGLPVEDSEMFLQAEGVAKPRRGSSDSSRSSGSNLSKDGSASGDRSGENTSQNAEGKVSLSYC